jgi:hypothetical protein
MHFLSDPRAVASAFSLPQDDGTFDDEFAAYLAEVSQKKPVVLLPFAPKSAGTFLRSAVIEATGGQLVRCVHALGGRDGQLYLPVFLRYYLGGVCEGPLVSHVHMQAFPATCRLIEALSLKPAIMIRPIPDMLASLWDMLLHDPAARTAGIAPDAGRKVQFKIDINCDIPEGFIAFADDRRADFLIDMIGPWYASYYATWLEYAQVRPEAVLVMRYRDFKADPAVALASLLDHVGLPRPPAACQAAIDAVWQERNRFRFNKGVAGRGRTYFDADHIAKLARMLSYYPVLEAYKGELL